MNKLKTGYSTDSKNQNLEGKEYRLYKKKVSVKEGECLPEYKIYGLSNKNSKIVMYMILKVFQKRVFVRLHLKRYS